MRSGRRSHTAGRSDVMTPAAQLDAKSCVLSFEEEVGYDPELDGPVTLGELLASEHEDPAQIGGRNVDWELFLSAHDYRYGVIAHAFASGGTLRDAAKMLHASYGSVYPLKARLAVALREFLGPESIADAARVPRWKASITVDREKTACQRDRRRSAH